MHFIAYCSAGPHTTYREDLRKQLTKERDTLRGISFSKDTELTKLRERTDKAVQDLATTRESLVAAQTTQTHLQERVDDLSKQLQAAQEKLAVFEHRPGATGPTRPVNEDLSREQQLELEVADLRLVIPFLWL